jgi:hypothetical protein
MPRDAWKQFIARLMVEEWKQELGDCEKRFRCASSRAKIETMKLTVAFGDRLWHVTV